LRSEVVDVLTNGDVDEGEKAVGRRCGKNPAPILAQAIGLVDEPVKVGSLLRGRELHDPTADDVAELDLRRIGRASWHVDQVVPLPAIAVEVTRARGDRAVDVVMRRARNTTVTGGEIRGELLQPVEGVRTRD
jgi:hypothetical protein